jgi:hypothetical protein
VNGNQNQGSVYVFTLVAGGVSGLGQPYYQPQWKPLAELVAPDGAAGDQFGTSVSLSGTNIAVGAPGADNAQGTVYVFVKSGKNWVQSSELRSSDSAVGDEFGTAVSLNGSSVIVGAPHHQVGTNPSEGAAYIFDKNSANWTLQNELVPGDGTAGDGFGTSVAVYLTTAVVGAPGHNGGSGSAYAYAKKGSAWSSSSEFTEIAVSSGGGSAVATNGSIIAVGAPGTLQSENGGVAIYKHTGSATNPWPHVTTIQGSVGSPNPPPIELGAGLAMQGTKILAGAPGDDVAVVIAQSGSAWKVTDEVGAWDVPTGTAVAMSGSTAMLGAPTRAPAGFVNVDHISSGSL